MSVLEVIAWSVPALLGLWVVVRVATAAFFVSKKQYERNDNGTQKHTRP